MGDVAEGAGVNQGRLALQRLHQIGPNRLVQQRHKGTLDAEPRHAHRRPAAGDAHYDAGKPLP